MAIKGMLLPTAAEMAAGQAKHAEEMEALRAAGFIALSGGAPAHRWGNDAQQMICYDTRLSKRPWVVYLRSGNFERHCKTVEGAIRACENYQP